MPLIQTISYNHSFCQNSMKEVTKVATLQSKYNNYLTGDFVCFKNFPY